MVVISTGVQQEHEAACGDTFGEFRQVQLLGTPKILVQGPIKALSIHSSKRTWLAGKSPCSMGNTSSTGPFSIAMLVYQRVSQVGKMGLDTCTV